MRNDELPSYQCSVCRRVASARKTPDMKGFMLPEGWGTVTISTDSGMTTRLLCEVHVQRVTYQLGERVQDVQLPEGPVPEVRERQTEESHRG